MTTATNTTAEWTWPTWMPGHTPTANDLVEAVQAAGRVIAAGCSVPNGRPATVTDHDSHGFDGGRCWACDCRPGGVWAWLPCGTRSLRHDADGAQAAAVAGIQ